MKWHPLLNLVQGREITNKTLFIYSWYNSANEHLLSTEANYESDIDKKSFHSMFIYPGIYLMTVSVHKTAGLELVKLSLYCLSEIKSNAL
jgi:hypothetical protein